METQGGYEIEITVGKGDHPLGLQITSATEGKLTIMVSYISFFPRNAPDNYT